jgi:hypothetical protein
VFFWHLLLLEQMTKEVPGIRPAVISTEPGTRMDEDYNGETTPSIIECRRGNFPIVWLMPLAFFFLNVP